MPEMKDEWAPTSHVGRSWKLTVAAILLAILPPLLPFPLYGLEQLWIGPLDSAAWQQCRAFYCPQAADLERLGAFLVLGPSLLVALALMLLGWIGAMHAHSHPTSSGNRDLFRGSVAFGVIWIALFGCILSFSLSLAGGTL